ATTAPASPSARWPRWRSRRRGRAAGCPIREWCSCCGPFSVGEADVDRLDEVGVAERGRGLRVEMRPRKVDEVVVRRDLGAGRLELGAVANGAVPDQHQAWLDVLLGRAEGERRAVHAGADLPA